MNPQDSVSPTAENSPEGPPFSPRSSPPSRPPQQALDFNKSRAKGPDEEVSAQEVAEWRALADAFLARDEGGRDSQLKSAQNSQKCTRLASYHWLVALDSGLQVHLGRGLAAFVLPGWRDPGDEERSAAAPEAAAAQDPARRIHGSQGRSKRIAARSSGDGGSGGASRRPAPEKAAAQAEREQQAVVRAASLAEQGELPIVSICLDQGSVGWPALFFLQHVQKVVLATVQEPPHRIWNDVQGAIDSIAPLRESRMLSTLLFNLNIGPFESAAWWQQVKDAISEYVSIAADDDPLLEHMWADIIDERGEHAFANDPQHRRVVLQSLPSMLKNKGSKVPRSRWFHFVDVCEEHDKVWSCRLLALLYLGLRLGWVTAEGAANFRLRTQKGLPPAGVEPQKTPTSGRAPAVMAEIRHGCHNTMHVASVLYTDRCLKLNNRLIATACRPLRVWHGLHCRQDRDPEAWRAFQVEQASGEFLGSSRSPLTPTGWSTWASQS